MKVKLISYTRTPNPDDPAADDLTVGQAIAYCARVSNPTNQANHGTAGRLLRYMADHGHWSPFEMAYVVIEVETTRDIAHQIIRHWSLRFQEFSQRYAEAFQFSEPREARRGDPKNRQMSHETTDPVLTAWWRDAQAELLVQSSALYAEALERGVAREVARCVLPEGLTTTRMYVAGTVRSWMHYCRARCAAGVQKEHREVAVACRAVLLGLVPELADYFSDEERGE